MILDIFPVYLICIYYILVILYLNRLLFILCTYNILNCNFVFEICIEHFYFEFFDFEHFPSDIFTSKNFYPSSNLLFLDIFTENIFVDYHILRIYHDVAMAQCVLSTYLIILDYSFRPLNEIAWFYHCFDVDVN